MIDNTFNEVIEETIKITIEKCCKELLPDQEYLNTKQAATYLGLSSQRLEIWRSHGGGPNFCKLMSAVRYRKSDLDEFMLAHIRSNSSESGVCDAS